MTAKPAFPEMAGFSFSSVYHVFPAHSSVSSPCLPSIFVPVSSSCLWCMRLSLLPALGPASCARIEYFGLLNDDCFVTCKGRCCWIALPVLWWMQGWCTSAGVSCMDPVRQLRVDTRIHRSVWNVSHRLHKPHTASHPQGIGRMVATIS